MNHYVNSKWVYGLICLAVILMIVWIIAGTYDNRENTAVIQETHTNEAVVSEEYKEDTQVYTENDEGYFLVKLNNGSVKVYWVDNSGEHLHKETSIPFDLLNSEDQLMLESGVKLENEEELDGFLENYDS